jgi:hypothetical protein
MPDMTYNHTEAFCLMKYRSDDGTEEEIIWNSRDGVTPFVIILKSGKSASHVEWNNDRCVPNHVPFPGSRVFVDLTRERALEIAKENLARWKDDSVMVHYGPYPPAEKLAVEYLDRHGAPDLVTVKEDGSY